MVSVPLTEAPSFYQKSGSGSISSRSFSPLTEAPSFYHDRRQPLERRPQSFSPLTEAPSFYRVFAHCCMPPNHRFSPLTEAPSFYQSMTFIMPWQGKFQSPYGGSIFLSNLRRANLNGAKLSFSPLTEAPSFYRESPDK